MGRMLESLKFSEGQRHGPREKLFFEGALERDPAMPLVGVEPETVPFIEVGPNKSLDGSPDVMAFKHGPQVPKLQPPHQSFERMAGPIIVQDLLPRPMQVALEPWPVGAILTGVAADIISFHQPEHPVSKQYGDLMSQMLESQQAAAVALLFVGGRGQVGTTTVVLNLAVSAARSGRGRVVVLDGNIRKPGAAARLGLAAAAGVQEVLAGRLALEQAIVKTPVANLHLLPAQLGSNAPLSADALRWLVSWLKARFDLILLDGPNVEAAAELSAMIPGCEGLYLVLPRGESSPSQRQAAQAIQALGGRLRGVVHTQFE